MVQIRKKGTFWDDTLETVSELGKSTAKNAVSSVRQTFNPLAILEQTVGIDEENNTAGEMKKGMEKLKKENNTKLDFDKLQKKYQDQDKLKEQAMRNRLFQLIKSEDEKLLQKKKQKEAEQKQQEAYEEQEKKRQQQEKIQQEQAATAPQGKKRRGLFSPKKVIERNVAEIKPSSGKQ